MQREGRQVVACSTLAEVGSKWQCVEQSDVMCGQHQEFPTVGWNTSPVSVFLARLNSSVDQPLPVSYMLLWRCHTTPACLTMYTWLLTEKEFGSWLWW